MRKPEKARSCPRRRVIARNVVAIVGVARGDASGARFFFGQDYARENKMEPLRYDYIEFWQDTDEIIDAKLAGITREPRAQRKAA